jgi:hypothetical protein
MQCSEERRGRTLRLVKRLEAKPFERLESAGVAALESRRLVSPELFEWTHRVGPPISLLLVLKSWHEVNLQEVAAPMPSRPVVTGSVTAAALQFRGRKEIEAWPQQRCPAGEKAVVTGIRSRRPVSAERAQLAEEAPEQASGSEVSIATPTDPCMPAAPSSSSRRSGQLSVRPG